MDMLYLFAVVLFILTTGTTARRDDDEEDPYTSTDPAKREPTPCEVCKYFATELQGRLDETANSKAVIETGHGFNKKKKFKYKTSELRLTEALHEPHICEKILEYNVHAERKGSNRYAKGQSETMSTLHGLVNKGVKVELGIPFELWDKPSAEVTKLQRSCFKLAEDHEDDIDEWYYNYQDNIGVLEYLCRDRYLKDKDQTCLDETFVPGQDDEDEKGEDGEKKTKKRKKNNKKTKKTLKGDTGAPTPAPPVDTDGLHPTHVHEDL